MCGNVVGHLVKSSLVDILVGTSVMDGLRHSFSAQLDPEDKEGMLGQQSSSCPSSMVININIGAAMIGNDCVMYNNAGSSSDTSFTEDIPDFDDEDGDLFRCDQSQELDEDDQMERGIVYSKNGDPGKPLFYCGTPDCDIEADLFKLMHDSEQEVDGPSISKESRPSSLSPSSSSFQSLPRSGRVMTTKTQKTNHEEMALQSEYIHPIANYPPTHPQPHYPPLSPLPPTPPCRDEPVYETSLPCPVVPSKGSPSISAGRRGSAPVFEGGKRKRESEIGISSTRDSASLVDMEAPCRDGVPMLESEYITVGPLPQSRLTDSMVESATRVLGFYSCINTHCKKQIEKILHKGSKTDGTFILWQVKRDFFVISVLYLQNVHNYKIRTDGDALYLNADGPRAVTLQSLVNLYIKEKIRLPTQSCGLANSPSPPANADTVSSSPPLPPKPSHGFLRLVEPVVLSQNSLRRTMGFKNL